MSQMLKPKKDLKNCGHQDWLRPWKQIARSPVYPVCSKVIYSKIVRHVNLFSDRLWYVYVELPVKL
jgi:hypothetical protein